MKKKLICYALTAIIAFQVPATALASTNHLTTFNNIELEVEAYSKTNNVGQIELGDGEVLELDINRMTSEQKESFYVLLEEEVDKAEAEALLNGEAFNRDEFKRTLIRMFDSTKMARSIHVPISNKAVAAGINLAIALLVGSGVGAVQTYIKAVGKSAAEFHMRRTIIDRLAAWGATYASHSIAVLVGFVLNYLDFGTRIAEYMDKNDRNGTNGYFDLYLF